MFSTEGDYGFSPIKPMAIKEWMVTNEWWIKTGI